MGALNKITPRAAGSWQAPAPRTGGVGEPDPPAAPQAVLNAVARPTGQRVCSLPF